MKHFSVIVSIIILLCCCTRQSAQLPSNKSISSSEKMDMMTYNKLCIEAEMAEIQSYLDSSSIEFVKSDAGYWYKIVNSNNGKKVDKIATISGTVQVLGGIPCYELGVRSEELGISVQTSGEPSSLELSRRVDDRQGIVQTEITSEASNYVLTIRLGKRDHTKVLDLALKNAHVGDEIWIVSPSSLAYGIKGISNCITSRTPVLYKIKVLNTNE